MSDGNLDKSPARTETIGASSAQANHGISLNRILRGIGCALSIFWLITVIVGMNLAILHLPFGIRVAETVISGIAVAVLFVCLKGRWRYGLGLPYLTLAVLALWTYWR
jgi:hypothetical protein